MPHSKNYLSGNFVDGEGAFNVLNPATGEELAQVPRATPAQIEEALENAAVAFERSRGESLNQRLPRILQFADALEEEKDRIVAELISETGKSADIAAYDFGMLVDALRFYSEEIKRYRGEVIPDYHGNHMNEVVPVPVGVVAGLLTWNFPLLNLAYKLGPMLASGCTGVFKISEHTPLATLSVAEIFNECGFEPGTLSLFCGDAAEASDAIASSRIPRLLTMIGSTFAGRKLVEKSATSIKRFSLELGGDAPVVIFPDANLEAAVTDVVGLKIANAGQICVAPNRVFVHRDCADAFVEKASALMQKFSPESAEYYLGPVVSEASLNRLLNLCDPGSHGGTVICGGGRLDRRGFFLQPTLIRDPERNCRLLSEEIFGPILPVMSFDDADDVWAMANDSEMGLSGYVFTSSLDRMLEARERLECGNILINGAHYSIQLPHGGLKQSGFGKDIGHHCLTDFHDLKRISIAKNECNH